MDITLYVILRAVHFLSVAIWLGSVPVDFFFRKQIEANRGKSGERKLISIWLRYSNFAGMAGLTGILLTGLLLTLQLQYGFFAFASGGNHWLYAKQFITVLLLLLTGGFIIPTARKIRIALQSDLESSGALSGDIYINFKKLKMVNTVAAVFVLLNFLFAATRMLFLK